MDKFMKVICVGMVTLTLALAGPVAALLALTVEPQTRIQVQHVVDKAPPFQSPLLLVQEPGQDAIVPPAANESVDAVPTTPNQEVVVEYGNWVQTLLKPIRDLGLALIPFVGFWIMGMLPGIVRMVVPATRVNEFLSASWLNAINSVDTAFKGKNYKVVILNNLLRQMAVYALAQGPVLVKQVADNLPELLQKLIRAVPPDYVPPGWTADQALKSVTPEAIKAAAAKQGVEKKVSKVLKDDGSFSSAILKGFGG